jgi:3-oxoacyl-[acyl-carrier protein] reductase
MADSLRLYGMKAIVTGAASGIGEAIARTFVKHGAAVLAVDASDSGIDRAFRRVQGIVALAVDPDAPTTAAKMTQTSLDEMGGVDILVNNHAARPKASADGGDPLDRMLQQIRETSNAVLPLLKQSPAGRIINVGCLRSAFGPDGDAALAATDDAIARLTALQAAEFGGHGINATWIRPGAIMTPQSRTVFDADKAFRDACIRRSAARRLGEPLDVAKVALFLASGDSVFVSGTGIAVDGGIVPEAAAV